MYDREDPPQWVIDRMTRDYEAEGTEPIRHGGWGTETRDGKTVRFGLCLIKDGPGVEWAENSDGITCPKCLYTLSMIWSETS